MRSRGLKVRLDEEISKWKSTHAREFSGTSKRPKTPSPLRDPRVGREENRRRRSETTRTRTSPGKFVKFEFYGGWLEGPPEKEVQGAALAEKKGLISNANTSSCV